MATKNTGRRTIQWPADSTRVEINPPAELEFWAKRFRVSASTLQLAVREVGHKFKDVEFDLRNKRDGKAP